MRLLPDEETVFRTEYWLKEDLIAVARELGLSTSGSKADLINSIASFKYHGITISSPKGPLQKSTKGKDLDLDSCIVTPYTNDEEHRSFFLKTIGSHFAFNVTFMNWMKENQGKGTYREAIAIWQQIYEEKKSGKKLAIGSQFEYNQYTRDFFFNNPGRTREDCITCWTYKKGKTGPHKYEDSDLMALNQMLLSKFNDQKYLKETQYKSGKNLNSRIGLHERFSTNPRGWFDWVFDILETLPKKARVLELGCGSANLWHSCLERIPSEWEITLSDFSEGMLADARQKLSDHSDRFAFAVVDAQSIPFPDGSFDIVIANHMLYHVPDRHLALSEIARVLAPPNSAGGSTASYVVASTFGPSHLKEIDDWIARFDSKAVTRGFLSHFTLENGRDQLSPFFADISLHRYPDSLRITEIEPLVDYIASATRAANLVEADFRRLREDLKAMLLAKGHIEVTKDSGLFRCVLKP